MTILDVGRFRFSYGDPHDVIGIVENAVFDVYGLRLIRGGSTVVDIGAGIGDFAVIASKAVGPMGRVIAIEPSPVDYTFLNENLRLNSCFNVASVNAGVGLSAEVVEFSFKGRSFRSSTRRLSGILDDLKVSPLTIGHVKIDIEGMEGVVVPENISLISRCHTVSIELHGKAGEPARAALEEAGFNFARVSRRGYFAQTARFSLRHPAQSLVLYRALREASGYHGIWKFLHGIDIASSSSLAAGVYVREKEPK